MTRQQLPQLLREFDPAAARRRLTGVTAPLNVGGVTWDSFEEHMSKAGLRNQIELLTGLLAEHSTGLLITLDEIHQNQIGELRELATTVQHAFREGRELAFAGAGLASAISDVMNDEVLTFLRRADRHMLASVSRARYASFRVLDRYLRCGRMEPPGLRADELDQEWVAVGAVDHHAQRVAGDGPPRRLDGLSEGALDVSALRRLGALVHEPALAGTSDIDKSFLLAMAKDDRPSKMSDIQQRMGVDINYASQYRLRLIAAELIQSPVEAMSTSRCPTFASTSANTLLRMSDRQHPRCLRRLPAPTVECRGSPGSPRGMRGRPGR